MHLTDTGWTDGYCTAGCEDSPCPDGTVCGDVAAGRLCLAGCDPGEACREGYLCAAGACVPDCRDGWSCGEKGTCGEDGRCRPELGDATIGEACSLPLDCATGLCFPERAVQAGTAWAGGYCAAPCPQGTPCPDGSACWALVDGPFCLDGCAAAGECREGYVCDPDWDVCLPDCRDGWTCGPNRCDPDGVCRPSASGPGGPGAGEPPG